MTAPVSAPKVSVPGLSLKRSDVEHYVKLAIAAIPAAVAVVAPDLSTATQGVLAGITTIVSSVELALHVKSGGK